MAMRVPMQDPTTVGQKQVLKRKQKLSQGFKAKSNRRKGNNLQYGIHAYVVCSCPDVNQKRTST